MSSVVWYVVVGNGFDCVGAFNAGFGWIRSIGAYPLAQAAKFVGIQHVPDSFVFGDVWRSPVSSSRTGRVSVWWVVRSGVVGLVLGTLVGALVYMCVCNLTSG